VGKGRRRDRAGDARGRVLARVPGVGGVESFLAWTAPLAPSTPEQIGAVAEQWQADLDFDSLDRLGGVAAPALVLTGEHDIVTPPRHGRQVAEHIPDARFELMMGTGASHGLMFERTEDFLRTVLAFLEGSSR
jgi:pimeloyl-ACP methyl ester carboxylesterase